MSPTLGAIIIFGCLALWLLGFALCFVAARSDRQIERMDCERRAYRERYR